MEGISIDYKVSCTDGAGVTKDKKSLENTEDKGKTTELLVEESGTGRRKPKHVADVYDNVYRTLLDDCPQLLIPLVNEIFDEHFTKEDKVVFSKDIHMMKGQKGKLSKRMTDSSFEIIGYARKKYLIEEQTRPDTSILIRIFEYSMLLAGSTGSVEDNMLTVSLPNCGVLFLRSSKNVPDKMKMKLEAPLGELLIDVLVMRLQDYTLEDMIRKDLLILFPFYLFRFSNSRLAECDQDEEQLETITSDYSRMQEHLTCLTDRGELSEFERYTILFLCNKVVESLAGKYENVVKGVQSVMGGKVLETDAKKILNEGINRGKIEGKIEGRREERVNTERECRRADVAEQKASMLQKELDAVKQQLRDLLQAQGPKLAEQ